MSLLNIIFKFRLKPFALRPMMAVIGLLLFLNPFFAAKAQCPYHFN